MATELTTKQEKFVQATIIGLNGLAAAKEAGYEGNDATLRAIASENLTKPNINEAISEFRAELKQESKDKIEQLLANWQELRLRCTGKLSDRPTEARCLENIGKHYGFYLEDNLQKGEQVQLDERKRAEAVRIANIRCLNLDKRA